MQSLYLCPATEDDLVASIRNPVPMDLIKEHFGPKYHDELAALLDGQDAVYCWAMSRGKSRKMPTGYEKMEVGDIVLFKETQTPATPAFDYRGEVIYKKPSSTFGGEVWPQGEDWHFVYFFKAIERINLDKRKLFSAIGYVPGRELSVQLRLAPGKLEDIYERYDTMDEFLTAVHSESSIAGPSTVAKKPSRPTLTNVPKDPAGDSPDWLAPVIDKARSLFQRNQTKQRELEVLVGMFYRACGFLNTHEIRYYGKNIDVRIKHDGVPFLVNEVKRDTNLSYRQKLVRSKAYTYAQEKDTPLVVITNGNYYAFLDRRKGVKWMENLVHELTLTRLTANDVHFLESCPWLKPTIEARQTD